MLEWLLKRGTGIELGVASSRKAEETAVDGTEATQSERCGSGGWDGAANEFVMREREMSHQ